MKSRLWWIIIVTGTILMVMVMYITGKPLKTATTPAGIINLELAFTSGGVDHVLNAWRLPRMFTLHPDGTHYGIGGQPLTDRIAAAKKNTYLDFIFIIFYTSLFVACCKTLSRKLTGNRFLSGLGSFMAKAAVAAALLDVVENIGMLTSLSGNISDTVALMTMIASSIKWLIVFFTILYIISAFIYWKAAKNRWL